MPINEINDFFIYLTTEHHLDHVHGLSVSNAHALDKLTFFAESIQHLIDLRTAAMHHYRVHADKFEQYHILRKTFFKMVVSHGVSAVFNDDSFVKKAFDVR